MLAFLKLPVDDASADQRAKISALYVFLLAAAAPACSSVMIALADRPTPTGIALLADLLGLSHGVDAGHTAAIDNVVRTHDFRWRAALRATR